jgi:predicted nucleotidyltransferase
MEIMTSLIEQNRTRLGQLCRQFGVKRLELFGSAAGSGFDEKASDLDFLVEFLPTDPAGHAHSYLNLLVALEDLFGRRIDLLEVKAIKNPYLMESINRTRIELYAA